MGRSVGSAPREPLCIMGATNSLLPDVCKAVPGRMATTDNSSSHRNGWPRARGWWGSEGEHGSSLGRGHKCPRSPDRAEAGDSANPSFIGPVFFTVKPQRTKGPANGEGG